MKADYHLHSHFSGDCQAPMKEVIEEAVRLKMDRLCFTDHHDLDFPDPEIDFTLDIPNYLEKIDEYKKLYKDKLQILTGIELGLQPHLYSTLSSIVHSHPFDFVLASSHLAQGLDPYDKSYFDGRTVRQGFLAYYEEMLENVTSYDDYDIYTHLDYIVRYGRFREDSIQDVYLEFPDLIRRILSTIIDHDKGIEINTSGYRYNLGNPHPTLAILKAYRELGGQKITIGSDAHRSIHLMADFDLARDLLKEAGFNYFTTYIKRVPEFHPLD